MSDQPELSKGNSSEWVLYLQQLMEYYGAWNGGQSGTFDDALEEAVVAFQTNYGVQPADGVVRASTWGVLTGSSAGGSNEEHHDAGAAQSTGQGAGADDSHAMHGSGAHPAEVPASFEAGGLPAFRYSLPSIPLAELTFETGAALVQVKLSMTGSVTVTFPHPAQGVSTSVNDGTWRVAASQSLDGITEGLRISGLGGETPSIGATYGHGFEQYETRFTPPDTVSFLGSCTVNYDVDTHVGTANVAGSLGYQLDVRVNPHPLPELVDVPEVVDERSWFEAHETQLAAAGAAATMALIVVVALAAAPETGGASLALLAL